MRRADRRDVEREGRVLGGACQTVGITLRVMEFPHAEREVYFMASLALPTFRSHFFLVCLVADSSVNFLRSWCVPTLWYVAEYTVLRRLIWNLAIWNLENDGAEHAVLA